MVWAHLFSLFYWVQMDNVTWRVLWNNPFWNEKLKYHFISFVTLRTYLVVQHCTLGSNLLALLGTYLDKLGQESNAWPSPQAMLKRPIWYPRIRNNWYLGNLNNGCKHALRIWKTEKIENPFISSFASENVGKKVTWAIFLRKFFVSDIEMHLHIESKYGALFFKANLLKGRQKISENFLEITRYVNDVYEHWIRTLFEEPNFAYHHLHSNWLRNPRSTNN